MTGMRNAPEYSGLPKKVVPCDGRSLRVREYPEAFKQLQRNFQLGPHGFEHSGIYFEIPFKPDEVEPDIQRNANIIRTFTIDLWTGMMYVEATTVDA